MAVYNLARSLLQTAAGLHGPNTAQRLRMCRPHNMTVPTQLHLAAPPFPIDTIFLPDGASAQVLIECPEKAVPGVDQP